MTTNKVEKSDELRAAIEEIRLAHPENGQNAFVRLGERAEGDLDLLSTKDRLSTLHRLLVEPQKCPISYGPAIHWKQLTETTIPALTVLEQRDPAIVMKATEFLKESMGIYYGENSFAVPLYLLEDFLKKSISNIESQLSVSHLLRRLNVTIDIHRQAAKDSGAPIARQLLPLKQCVRAESLIVTLHGEGSLHGTDFASQSTIQLIATVVGELLMQFGAKLSIVRACNGKTMDISSYWSTPIVDEKRHFRDGSPSVAGMMQTQVHQWKGGR